MMDKIEEFVYDPTSEKTLIFHIGSYSLKKALAREVTRVYMSTGVFTEFQRALPETIIKKSKSFKQANFLRGFAKPETQTQVKIAELGFCEESVSASANVTSQSNSNDKATSFAKHAEETKDAEMASATLSKRSSIGLAHTDDGLKSEMESLSMADQTEFEQLFSQELGFSRVVEQLILFKKPLVGHNMIYDVAFLYH